MPVVVEALHYQRTVNERPLLLDRSEMGETERKMKAADSLEMCTSTTILTTLRLDV